MKDTTYAFDIDKKYMFPMSKVDESEYIETPVICDVQTGSKPEIIVISAAGYRTKRMYKKYFEHLLYNGYAKVVD